MELIQRARFEGSVFCLSNTPQGGVDTASKKGRCKFSKLMVGPYIYSTNNFELIAELGVEVVNAELTESACLVATANSLIMWTHLDEGPTSVVLWKGSYGVPPVALAVDDREGVGWVKGRYEVYTADGVKTLTIRSPFTSPLKARRHGAKLFVLQSDKHLIALDFTQGTLLQSWVKLYIGLRVFSC